MTTQNNKQRQTGDNKKWQAHFAAQAKSGLSVAEYCRRQQISYHAFGYWWRKLGRTAGNNIALVPITMNAEPGRSTGFGGAVDLTIILPGNMSIAVGDNFFGVTLNRLLNVLSAR